MEFKGSGQTIDFLLTAKRDLKAAKRFLKKAIRHNGEPEKINTDKSGANTAGIHAVNKESNRTIEIRQKKYLNSIVEQEESLLAWDQYGLLKRLRTALC